MGALIILLVLLALYFLPCWVAFARDIEDVNGIIIVNLLLGWTLVGWVVALVWAVSGKSKAEKKAAAQEMASAISAALQADRASRAEAGEH